MSEDRNSVTFGFESAETALAAAEAHDAVAEEEEKRASLYGGFDGQVLSPPPGFGTTSLDSPLGSEQASPLGVSPPPLLQTDGEQDALLKMVASIGWDSHGAEAAAHIRGMGPVETAQPGAPSSEAGSYPTTQQHVYHPPNHHSPNQRPDSVTSVGSELLGFSDVTSPIPSPPYQSHSPSLHKSPTPGFDGPGNASQNPSGAAEDDTGAAVVVQRRSRSSLRSRSSSNRSSPAAPAPAPTSPGGSAAPLASPGAGGRGSVNSMWGFLDVRNEDTVRRSLSRGSISSLHGPDAEQAHSALIRRSSSEASGIVVFGAFDEAQDEVRRTSGSRTMLRRLSMEGAALAAAAGGNRSDFVGVNSDDSDGEVGNESDEGDRLEAAAGIPNFGNILRTKVDALFDGFEDGEARRKKTNSLSSRLVADFAGLDLKELMDSVATTPGITPPPGSVTTSPFASPKQRSTHDMLNGVKEEEFQGFKCYVYHKGVTKRQLQQVPDALLEPGADVNADDGLDEIIGIKNEVADHEQSCLVELVVSSTHILCTAVIPPGAAEEEDEDEDEDEDDPSTLTMSMEDLQLAFYRPFADVARIDRIDSTWVALTFSPDPVALYSPEPPSGNPPGDDDDGDGLPDYNLSASVSGNDGGSDPLGHAVNIFALETEDEAMALCLAISTAVIESDYSATALPDNLTTAL